MAIRTGFGRLLVPLALGSAVVAEAQPAVLDRGNFRSEVRRVLHEHVVWTRLYLISATTDQPDKAAVEKRLLKNADDFADLLKPFYSTAEAARLGSLFRDHIQLAGVIIESANQVDGGLREPLNKR